MTLPSISPKQQKILSLLYTYRFLTITQLQQFIGDRERRSVQRWLYDLRSKKYVEWRYDTDFIGRTKPATYYIGRNGIRWLRSTGKYPESELIKRYRDSHRTDAYIETCRLVAQLAVQMTAIEAVQGIERYAWYLPPDYVQWEPVPRNLIMLQPSLMFVRHTFTGSEHREAPYLLEIVRRSASVLYVRQRLTTYLRYLAGGDWDETFKVSPTVLFVCPDKRSMRAAKRQTRRLLQDEAYMTPIRFTTIDMLAATGVLGPIWGSAVSKMYKVQ